MAARHPCLLAGTFFQWVTWHQEESVGPQNHGSGELRMQRVAIREFSEGLTAIPPGMVDLEVTCFDTNEGIDLRGVYRADLFSSADMDLFIEDLRLSARQFVLDPDTQYALLPTRDSRQMVDSRAPAA